MATTRLRDVAERAGVSIRTVSNVVNGYAPVAEETRLRVEKAVAELGYRPNLLARNLKRGRTGMLALVVPELDVPYFSELARAVIAEARTRGYTVVIDQTDGEPDRERELIMRGASAARFDGVILSPLSLSQADLAQRDGADPLVLLGERIAESQYDHVAIDNVAAAYAATEHLLDLGRTRIAAVGDQPYDTGETAQLRTRGYRDAHAARGLAVDESLILATPRFHLSDGAAAMAALLDHPGGPPDAVFCYNDLLALGAIRTLLTRGLRVPEDVAVVGFDDIETGRYNTPTLTTVSPDKATIARLAVERITGRLDDALKDPPVELWAPHQLVVRESTVGR
ncbi:LacI family DNA-binding transcriptional regulator [Streptomyces sp. WAC00263]|uniref:LacI family DNA-binding transcriptional regulator n=1 Tax=Streptomyces sp. WAC00263 TaxID=1917422 RepID=UPI0015EEAFD8|nr:LacI family DNA-binding transcriptional regulator [Streptomyces sp. WAC00263]KAF5998777.1 LacI family transcriptional regulator [Streptomyces sp. WAC00263]